VAFAAAQPANRGHRAVRPAQPRRIARRDGAGPGAAASPERALVDAECGRDAPVRVEGSGRRAATGPARSVAGPGGR
jgi:hypothetical protein